MVKYTQMNYKEAERKRREINCQYATAVTLKDKSTKEPSPNQEAIVACELLCKLENSPKDLRCKEAGGSCCLLGVLGKTKK